MKACEKLIQVAKQEEGYLEKTSSKDLDSKTANAGKIIIQSMPETFTQNCKASLGATCL
jgi:hypothetical protein